MEQSDFVYKMRRVFLPIIVLNLLFFAGYSTLNGLFIYYQARATEGFTDLVLPFLLVWIPVILGVLPRLSVLHWGQTRGNTRFNFVIFTALIMTIPVVMAQKYVRLAAGRMVRVTTVDEINPGDPFKFYQVAQHLVDKKNRLEYKSSRITGKRRSGVEFSWYVVCPVKAPLPPPPKRNNAKSLHLPKGQVPMILINGQWFHDASILGSLDPNDVSEVKVLKDPVSTSYYGAEARYGVILIQTKHPLHPSLLPFDPLAVKVWIGLRYTRTVSNRLSAPVLESEGQRFYDESLREFERADLSRFGYLDRLGDNRQRDGFLQVFKEQNVVFPVLPVLVVAHPERFEDRLEGAVVWVGGALVIAALLWFLWIWRIPVDKERLLERAEVEQ